MHADQKLIDILRGPGRPAGPHREPVRRRPRLTDVRRVAWLTVLALVLTTGLGGAAAPPPPAPATGADTFVLRVEAFAAMAVLSDRWRLPQISVYGDGRVVVATEAPGVLQTATEQRLSPAELRLLHNLARRAGLHHARRLDRPGIVDGSTLAVTVHTAAGPRRTEVDTPGMNERGARRRVVEFVQRLRATLRAAPSAPYRGTRLALVVLPADSDGREVRPWPFTGVLPPWPAWQPCRSVEGPLVRVAEEATRDAGPRTVWQAGGERAGLLVRPLLPDERSCAELPR